VFQAEEEGSGVFEVLRVFLALGCALITGRGDIGAYGGCLGSLIAGML